MALALAPGRLSDASKFPGTPAISVVGDVKNLAVGVLAGGRMTPSGTRRISAENALAACASVPTGIARTVTMLEVAPLEVGGAGGAVYTTVARPSAPVTMVRADRVPKSTTVPSTTMSMRIATPAAAWPVEPTTRTATDDCDCPSRVMLSGVALTVTDW